MSDAQLIQAIFDFPFVCEIHMYPTIEYGVEVFESICDAYAELIERESGFKSFMSYAERKIEVYTKDITAEEEIKNERLAALILFQPNFKSELNVECVEKITMISTMIDYKIEDTAKQYNIPRGSVIPTEFYVYTPRGNAVPCETRTCSHDSSSFHSTQDATIVSQYGVTLVSSGTCKYNCHSYAWYNQSTTNSYYMKNPALYMTDGSYTKIMSGLSMGSSNVPSGAKVFYGQTTNLSMAHSAIINNTASSGTLGGRWALSKWGQNGVFRHKVSNVPSSYDVIHISAWKRS